MRCGYTGQNMRAKGPRISEKGYLEQGMIITQLGQETEGPR
jgi:hypothetical protein